MENDLNKYLGLRVRSLRENAQMTQEELANVCDVSWRTISNLERGCVTPDLVMICKISKNLTSVWTTCSTLKFSGASQCPGLPPRIC